MPNRLLVVDPGFYLPWGHHYSTAIMIDSACQKYNIDLELYISSDLAENSFSHTFTGQLRCVMQQTLYSPYLANLKYIAAFTVQEALIFGDYLADDLTRHLTDVPSLPNTVILCHSAGPSTIIGFCKWLKKLPADQHPHVVINFQNHIGDHEFYKALYVPLLKQILQNSKVRIFCGNLAICHLFNNLSGAHFNVFPLPFSPPQGYARPNRKVSLFGLAGAAHLERNLYILPAAIRAYFEQGGTGDFSLQLHFIETSDLLMSKFKEELAKLCEDYHSRVKLKAFPLYGPDYCRHIADCDVLLLPYEPRLYKFRTSQVMLEASALGVSSIVCRGTSMEQDLSSLNNGSVFMETESTESLTAALFEFDRNREENRKLATLAADKISSYHNPDIYLKVVFDTNNDYIYPAHANGDDHE